MFTRDSRKRPSKGRIWNGEPRSSPPKKAIEIDRGDHRQCFPRALRCMSADHTGCPWLVTHPVTPVGRTTLPLRIHDVCWGLMRGRKTRGGAVSCARRFCGFKRDVTNNSLLYSFMHRHSERAGSSVRKEDVGDFMGVRTFSLDLDHVQGTAKRDSLHLLQ